MKENDIILENLSELEEEVAEEVKLKVECQCDEPNDTDDDSDKDAPDSSNNYPPDMDNTLLQ
jgi:hypothetical protein